MNIFNILIEWNWCNRPEIINVFDLIKSVVDIIRIAVPIILVVMTTLDIINRVINPNDKNGQNKIMNRLIAGVIVFFIPTIISFTFRVIDMGTGNDEGNAGLSACWR